MARVLDVILGSGRRSRIPSLRPLTVAEKTSTAPSLVHEQGFTGRERGLVRESAPTFNDL